MLSILLSFPLFAQEQLSENFDNPTELAIKSDCLFKSYIYD